MFSKTNKYHDFVLLEKKRQVMRIIGVSQNYLLYIYIYIYVRRVRSAGYK